MDRSAYDRHVELDQQHFWRVAKRRLVLECLAQRLLDVPRWPDVTQRRVLDIGGACSVISQQLSAFGDVTVVEPDADSVALARSQLGVQARVGALPHDLHVSGPFHIVVLLDVLEHVEEDLESLRIIRSLLDPSGVLILTTPAYQWLWSSHDQVLHHHRRYSRRRLRNLLHSAGYRVQRLSYYTGFLLPLVALQRLYYRLRRSPATLTYRVHVPGRAVNTSLQAVMSMERWLLRHVNMPFGSSLLAVADANVEAPTMTDDSVAESCRAAARPATRRGVEA